MGFRELDCTIIYQEFFFNDESVNAEAGRGVNKRIIDHLYITRGVQGPKLEHV